VSQQARRRRLVRQWQWQEVRDVAEREWKGEPPVAEELMVTIIYVYDAIPLDVDNIPKPILDALNGLVYSDDSQVSDILCRRRDRRRDLRILNASPMLLDYIDKPGQFLHITVGDAPSQEVTF
jgi:hypothetical protein